MADNDRSSRGREDNRWLPAEVVLHRVYPAPAESGEEDGIRTVDTGASDTTQDGGNHAAGSIVERPQRSLQQTVRCVR